MIVTDFYGGSGHDRDDVVRPTCEYIDSVSDADFGFWDHEWGQPSIHEFECDRPADIIIDENTPYGTTSVMLCAGHAKAVL